MMAETKLSRLATANQPERRAHWARQWQARGGKVLGVLGPSVPEEVIAAAGILPWRITGTWDGDRSLAAAHRPANTCLFCNHVLEALLRGDLDFLDGVVATNWDDEVKRLWDVWRVLRPDHFSFIVHLPHFDGPVAHQYLAAQLRDLWLAIGKSLGCAPGEETLEGAIAEYNRGRSLLRALYDLRKAQAPALSGAECLGVTTAATVMPKSAFNDELAALLPELTQRRAPLARAAPRLLVSSDLLDHPGYLRLVEDLGCVVAMDDLDTGSRSCCVDVAEDGDPFLALARRYIAAEGGARAVFWDEQFQRVLGWVREFAVDGVIELPEAFQFTRLFRSPVLAREMEKAGVPFLSVPREYRLAGEGQLQVRVQAFLEMLAES